MKNENRIEEKEHSQRVENQTKTQIQLYLEWILGLINYLALHDHHQWRNHKICVRKWWNRSEKMKKNEEQLREKRKLAQQVLYKMKF